MTASAGVPASSSDPSTAAWVVRTLAPLAALGPTDLLTPTIAIGHYDTIRQQLAAAVAERMGLIDVDTLRYYRRRAVNVLSPAQTPQGHLTRQHVEELLVIRLGAAVRHWTLSDTRAQLQHTPDRHALLQELLIEAQPVRALPRARASAPPQPVPVAGHVPVRPLALPSAAPRRVTLPHGVVVEIPADAPVFQPGPARRAVLRALAKTLRPPPALSPTPEG